MIKQLFNTKKDGQKGGTIYYHTFFGYTIPSLYKGYWNTILRYIKLY